MDTPTETQTQNAQNSTPYDTYIITFTGKKHQMYGTLDNYRHLFAPSVTLAVAGNHIAILTNCYYTIRNTTKIERLQVLYHNIRNPTELDTSHSRSELPYTVQNKNSNTQSHSQTNISWTHNVSRRRSTLRSLFLRTNPRMRPRCHTSTRGQNTIPESKQQQAHSNPIPRETSLLFPSSQHFADTLHDGSSQQPHSTEPRNS